MNWKKFFFAAAGLGILVWIVLAAKSLEIVNAENGVPIASLLEEAGFARADTTVTVQGGTAYPDCLPLEIADPELLEQFYSHFFDHCYLSHTHLRNLARWDRGSEHYILHFTDGHQAEAMTFYLCGVKNTHVTWQGTDYYCTADTVGSIINLLRSA